MPQAAGKPTSEVKQFSQRFKTLHSNAWQPKLSKGVVNYHLYS